MNDEPNPDGSWPLAVVHGRAAAPCIGSGFCCKQRRCFLGARKHGPGADCPSLVERDGRHWCGELLAAGAEEATVIRRELYIGAGCCSALNSDRASLLRKVRREAVPVEER